MMWVVVALSSLSLMISILSARWAREAARLTLKLIVLWGKSPIDRPLPILCANHLIPFDSCRRCNPKSKGLTP